MVRACFFVLLTIKYQYIYFSMVNTQKYDQLRWFLLHNVWTFNKKVDTLRGHTNGLLLEVQILLSAVRGHNPSFAYR